MPDYPVPDTADVDLVHVFKALADPIRLQIVLALADGEPKPKSSEEWGFAVHKTTLTHHFRILRESGLTVYLVHGRTHSIQLRRDELNLRFPGLIDSVVRSAQQGAIRA